MGYSRDALKGVSWITLLRFLSRIISFIRLGILGRLLTPVQFGFFGIASLLLSLLEVFTETGINVFLVQERSDINEYVSSAWMVSMIRGLLLSLLILFLSPYIASFFTSPSARSIISLIAIVPFIRGFINPAIVIYPKELFFDKEFKLRSFLFAIEAFVSVITGIITRSAVCFVYGLIASVIFEVILSYTLIPTRPKFSFEFKKLKKVVHSGSWVTISGIFSYFADNTDNITVGKILGSSTLGVYQVAYKFSTLPISEITNVVNMVIFPVYSKFSHDKGRLKKNFLKVTIASSITAFILSSVIFIFAKPIILIVMGNNWVSAVPAIKILSIYGFLRTVFGNFAPLFLSLQKQSWVAKTTFIRVFGLALIIIPMVRLYGMVGAGLAMFISIIIEIPAILFFAKKIFETSV